MTINEVINKFNNVKGGGNQYTARCPAHDDNANSLSIGCGEDGKILIYCHAGCANEAILEAVGLSVNDLFVREEKPVTKQIEAVYDYTDIDGNVLHSSVRYKNPKSFAQRRPDPDNPGRYIYNLKDIKTVIYNLPAVIDAIKQNKPIFIAEGEKDVDNLARLGYTTTTNPMGAGKWRDYHSDYLIGAEVYVISDNDEPGRKHVLSVGRSLTGKAKSIHVIDPKTDLAGLPEHGDITDYLRTFKNRDGATAGFNKLISGAISFQQYDNTESAESGSFELMSAKDLQRADLPPIRFIVSNILPQGLTLLAAPSKYGKSWMTLDLCLSIAEGVPFLGFNTEKCGVLYLALEDGYRRLQQRMNAILKKEKGAGRI